MSQLIIQGLRPTEYFTKIPNQVLLQVELSGLAIAIAGYILANPERRNDGTPWDINMNALYRRFARDSKYKIRLAVQELQDAGLLAIDYIRDESGRRFANRGWRFLLDKVTSVARVRSGSQNEDTQNDRDGAHNKNADNKNYQEQQTMADGQDCPASFEEAAQDPSATGTDCSAPADTPPVANPPLHIVARLEQEGMDSKGARYLASKYSEHEIMRQIGWIGQRGATQNRAGMLRRAIEQNWAEPRQSGEPTPEQQAAAREQKRQFSEQVEQWVASLVAGQTQLKNSLGQVLTFIKRECSSLLVELDGQRSMVSAEVAFQKCTVVA